MYLRHVPKKGLNVWWVKCNGTSVSNSNVKKKKKGTLHLVDFTLPAPLEKKGKNEIRGSAPPRTFTREKERGKKRGKKRRDRLVSLLLERGRTRKAKTHFGNSHDLRQEARGERGGEPVVPRHFSAPSWGTN